MTSGPVFDTLGHPQASWVNTESLCSAALKKNKMREWMWVIKAGGVDHRRCQVQNRDLQQLVDEGLLVHHVCHIWHIELMKLWAVLQHNVSNLSDQHALSQSHFQIHEKPGRRRRSSVLTSTHSVKKNIRGTVCGALTFHWLPWRDERWKTKCDAPF